MSKHTKAAKKTKFRYEIGIPVKEIWHMEVEAHSLKEALEKIRNGDLGVYQICSTAGFTSSKPYIIKREKV